MSEATMILVDNSEFMRNGDYTPSRLEAQKDAANLLLDAKLRSHPENTVGVLSMAGTVPKVLVNLSTEVGPLISSLNSLQPNGMMHLLTSLNVAQLALKHRQNKQQRQRLLVFVGSPVSDDEADLLKLAKKLKKNNVHVDIINFGEVSQNVTKLEAFIQNVTVEDSSHVVTVPPGPHILADMLLSTPILAGAPAQEEEMDPELALALRLSRQEEEERQARAQHATVMTTSVSQSDAVQAGNAAMEDIEGEPAGGTSDGSVGGAAGTHGDLAASFGQFGEQELSEEDQIALAIALSLQQDQQQQQQQPQPQPQPQQGSTSSRTPGSAPGNAPSDPSQGPNANSRGGQGTD